MWWDEGETANEINGRYKKQTESQREQRYHKNKMVGKEQRGFTWDGNPCKQGG